mmetsp:Transcript_24139/g.59246  ORF Transcript_24139/g.59246 Transcript_24139/m.59246 type:complete len:255 (-) Transcript_24139:92-856(-)
MTAVMRPPASRPNAAASSSTTAAADSARYVLDAARVETSSATMAPKLTASASGISPAARRAAIARTSAATPKSCPMSMSRASDPLVDCVIGSREDLSSLRPSGRDTRGISEKAAVRARAKPWRAPLRPEPRPRARRLRAYTTTGEQPVMSGAWCPCPCPPPFSSPPAPPPPIMIRSPPSSSGPCASCAALSSLTRLTADLRRTSASMLARSQKCWSTCPGTSECRTISLVSLSLSSARTPSISQTNVRKSRATR